MITSICVLSCALTFGQAADRAEWQLTPQLTPGLELVYKGTYTDESLIPNVQYQRQYRLETSLLVLDAKTKECQAAFLTVLRVQDRGQPLDKQAAGPMSVRLELAKIDLEGRCRLADKKLLEIPLDGMPTLENGFLAAAPLLKVGRNFTWQVVNAGRPVQHWQIVGVEACGGIRCIKTVAVQQSEHWDSPRADQAAWRRRDTLWILPQLNVAQKVERIIEHREPARDRPTRRTVVQYELESRLKYPGSLFEDRRQEILRAIKFHDEAELLVRQPGIYRPQIDTLLARLNMHLARPTSTYYRNAFLHVKTVLENAKKGEGAVPHPVEDPTAYGIKALDVGQRAPDFAVSNLTEEKTARLQSFLGKPVLVIFYNPGTPTGKDVIAYAKELSEKQGKNVAIMAMAITPYPDIALVQHEKMRLTFPILDGNGMRLTFGATQTPRLVLLDANGFVRLAQTGWGYQTPYEIQEELDRCQSKGP